jgi:hypothetical protein
MVEASLNYIPSPLMGEGVGGGDKMVKITPHLNPPTRGEEISTERRDLYARI